MPRAVDAPFAPPPGARLREAHAHVHQHGRAMGMVNLSACTTPGEMVEAIAAARRARLTAGHGPDVLAHGARPESWDPPRWPSLAEIDRACPDGVVLAWCFDHHTLMAGTRALAAAGLDRPGADPPGGIIARAPDGAPTGVLHEHAALLAWDAAPQPGPAARRDAVRDALADLARLGFAEVHDLKAQPWLPEALADLESAGELPTDVVLFPLVEHAGAMAESRRAWSSDRVRLGGAKIFVDGTLNSRTAWVLEPFADGAEDRPCGAPMMSRAEIADAVARCAGLGVGLAAHAIGDAAVRAVLDAVETGPALPSCRIEHAELVHPADVPRFAALRVVCSVQPCHLLYDIEALLRAVPDRLERVLPLRSLVRSGCAPGEGLIFGSDTPIVRPDPEDSLRAAVARARAGEESVIGEEESLTFDEALRCFGVGRIERRPVVL